MTFIRKYDWARINALWKEGLSTTQIAEAIGITARRNGSVTRVLKKMGIDVKASKRRKPARASFRPDRRTIAIWCEMRGDKIPVQWIADLYGSTYATVWGYTCHLNVRDIPRVSGEQRLAIIRLHQREHLSRAEIARRVGVSEETVRRIVKPYPRITKETAREQLAA